MVVLRLGKINNEERKFIPTRLDALEEYLQSMEEIEEYELIQTYRDGYKYRRYNDHGNMKYTRNFKMDKVTDVVEISEEEFLEVLKDTKKVFVRFVNIIKMTIMKLMLIILLNRFL